MKIVNSLCAVGVVLGGAFGMTQAAVAAPATPVAKTTCQDYLALDETVKPKFIYYAAGLSKKGQETAVLDVEGTERIKPELDQYCKVNLTKSAYEQVMKSSMASEKTNR